jgi:hypothetical protein
MKSEQPDIDKLFKDKLYNLESKDKPDSWKNISAKLDQQKGEGSVIKLKNRGHRIRFYVAAAIILFIVSFSLLLAINSFEKENIVLAPEPKKGIKSTEGSYSVISKSNIADLKSVEKKEYQKKETNISQDDKDILITLSTQNEKKDFYLPDSSRIYLNRNSELSYHEKFAERKLNIMGEVYFEVKHKDNEPFVIYANRSRTEVIGTSFMIRSYKEKAEDEIFVSSGKVAFASKNNPREQIFLEVGNHAIANDKELIKNPGISDINYAAWKNEKIIFKSSKMTEVISTLEKYYGITIQVNDPEIMNCKYTGVFHKSDIKNTLDLLSISFNLSYDKKDGKYMLSGKGCK